MPTPPQGEGGYPMPYTEMSKLAPDAIRVWADLDAGHVIDMVDPDTDCTVINGKDADQVLTETPTAIELTLAQFLRWKASKQNTPIEWLPSDEAAYDWGLGCIMPVSMLRGGFLVGEISDHCAASGLPRYQAYRRRGDTYEAASRPMTRREFIRQMGGE